MINTAQISVFFLIAFFVVIFGCDKIEKKDDFDHVEYLWFEYEGRDDVFSKPLAEGSYQNPIIAGFYPDPSIVRVEDDYYLTTSSFSYFPGLPILHSKDLVNWKLIGHGLNSLKQVQFNQEEGISRGIFAPTIRYHDGLFYVITTDVDGIGNFIITAKDPAGPWSAPIQLPEINGIDPDIFFNDDGRVYIAHNGPPKGSPLYEGHRAIWLWELDLNSSKIIADSGRIIVDGGVDISKQPIWIEAPHIYKKGSWYYLSCAEGGTSTQHSQVIFRTRDLSKPFLPYKNNPILTQRDLKENRPHPITSTGHADFVQTPSGQWWAVFLGVRPYGDGFHNIGRETYMLPVLWKDDWPHILPPETPVPYTHALPSLVVVGDDTPPQTGSFKWRDEYDRGVLDLNWTKVRTSAKLWHTFRNGRLLLLPQGISLSERMQPSYLARRQQHNNFLAKTEFRLPANEKVLAGIAAFQSSSYNYSLGVVKVHDQYELRLNRTFDGKVERIESTQLSIMGKTITLGLEQVESEMNFFYLDENASKIYIHKNADATILSTQVAGGFVGATVGPYAYITEN